MNVDQRLKRAVRKTAAQITDSGIFLLIFNEHMIDEVIPLVQMGLAVYLDKPVVIICPKSRLAGIPANIKRLALTIESWDDSLPRELEESAMLAATTRAIQAVPGKSTPDPEEDIHDT